jgi:hypothetical protein
MPTVRSKRGPVHVRTSAYRSNDCYENAKLKRMLADAMLDNVALKDLLGKKW